MSFYSGGSTGTGAMIYLCGADRDFNHWESQGNSGWDYQSLLPYFKKSENNVDPKYVGNGRYHGTGGYLTVSTTVDDPLEPTIRSAYSQLGYKILTDYNAQQYNGVVKVQSTIKNGEKVNSNFLSWSQ